ncbi:spore germination protein [Brevibacillus fluminis]|uniref:Spore germination protein n=1 Tax=Brevibacillus fluminis TaxID=511487 RepID=A0A3M8CUM5_9BACL|nr:spore germination protein [Brevibacillus fluminis]RNB78535.1 spore germination protein [Brevibacillus fluminis]
MINEEQLKEIKESLASYDFHVHPLRSKQLQGEMVYIKTLCDESIIEEVITKPFLRANDQTEFEHALISNPRTRREDPFPLDVELLAGNAAVFVLDRHYFVDVKKTISINVREATVESIIQGPQYALSENIETSLFILRQRYQNKNLQIITKEIGTKTNAKIAILYDESFANESIVSEIEKRIDSICVPSLQGIGHLQRLLNGRSTSLFPTLLSTERQDRVVLNLSQGKVVILLNGTSFALLAPSVFWDFFSAMDDLNLPYWITHFLVCLRYIGLFISLFLPALYVVFTSYNPEIFRIQLALSIAGSREAVPYPSFLEVLFMLLMMELLTEASLRLPKSIGQTATTVGGLILGQAATAAGLVSNIMIILVAAVAISNFVIPINTMSFSMRVMKYPILLVATLFGLLGVVISLIFLVHRLALLDSLGEPFLRRKPNMRDQGRGP